MLALSAETGLADSGLLQGVAVALASGLVTGIATYSWLARRLGAPFLTPRAVETPERLDEVVKARADALGIRLPVETVGAKPVKVRFTDGSEVFYFARDLHRYDWHVYGGLTPLDRSTIDDPPRTISEWPRNEKIQWLSEHPFEMDQSQAH